MHDGNEMLCKIEETNLDFRTGLVRDKRTDRALNFNSNDHLTVRHRQLDQQLRA